MGVFRGDFVAVFNRFLFKFILSLEMSDELFCLFEVDVLNRLLRRYAPPPLTLGEVPSYYVGCQCYTPAS